MGEEIKKLTRTGRIQWSAYNLVAEWVLRAWNQVNNPEAQNKNGEYVYIDEDNASDGESIVDLTQNDNGDKNENENNQNGIRNNQEVCDEDTYYNEWVVEYVN
ncbi:6547_t:CDS:2, partial [Racocetra fulgida]